ncbi:MAG: 3-deoxy-D-manno-octulosonic acid transferase [Amphiplicatus sp.]
MQPAPSKPLGLKLYRAASRVAGPLAELALQHRLRAGKEDPERIGERRGQAGRARPPGALVWIHGASVGESLSVLPLVERLRGARGDLNFLVTTGSITSARLMQERLPEGALHQYIPLDHPRYVKAFLDHWRPDAALFVESEFWPNLILAAREKARFLALVNGRVSPKSFEEWSRKLQMVRYVLSSFDVLMAQDRQNAERLETLSGRGVLNFGNLKNAAPPLPVVEGAIEALRAENGNRPIWLAASTHPGEEEAVFNAHKALKSTFPTLLTLLAPRHPERGAEVRALAESFSLSARQRSDAQKIDDATDIYIADTLGELGLFYRLSDISFVGGSMTPKGGHNPLEPARLGGAILHGPFTFNFDETYADMRAAGGAALVRNDRELATAVRRLLSDEKTRRAMAEAAQKGAEASAEKVLLHICDVLLERFDASARAA